MEPRKEAVKHLEAAVDKADAGAAVQVAVAGVYAVLHLADAVRHGLRDILYELRS